MLCRDLCGYTTVKKLIDYSLHQYSVSAHFKAFVHSLHPLCAPVVHP